MDGMTADQANKLIAEVWNLKMELVRLTEAQAVQNQQTIELLNSVVTIGNMLGLALGFMTGVIFAILVVKGFDG